MISVSQIRVRPRAVLMRRLQDAVQPVPPFQTTFYPARRVVEAPTHAARASIVLGLSDALASEHCDELRNACLAAGFEDGARFIDTRVLAALAERGPDGRLPSDIERSLEVWRRGIVAIAQAGMP